MGGLGSRRPGSRRDGAIDISAPKGIELRPKHRAFEFEGGDDGILRGASRGVLLHVIEGEFTVALGLRRALRKIRERFLADEIIMGKHARNALVDDGGGKQFREGRGDRLKQAPRAAEFDIGLDGETRARQYALRRGHIIARKAQAIGELQAALDAAIAYFAAVMILDALAP